MTHIDAFDYDLPEHMIAQTPIEPRDASRLLQLNRQTGAVSHHIFREIGDFLQAGDVLVMNNTRVIPARLQAQKTTGGAVEVLLLRQVGELRWRVLVGGRRVHPGVTLTFDGSEITAEVVEALHEAERLLEFSQPINALLRDLGETPLPPYIHAKLSDSERYQTVYSQQEGSAAAPTAGLHVTPRLLDALRERGVKLAFCTLHIGLDTFQPVKVERIEEHKIHSEYAELDEANAAIINDAKANGGRVIAVGTTSARTLETAGILSAGGDPAQPGSGLMPPPERVVMPFAQDTNLYIVPGYQWRVLDGLVTNFHLPKSTLLMMISAFAGRERVLAAYERAKQEGYRFYSFGDAMLLL